MSDDPPRVADDKSPCPTPRIIGSVDLLQGQKEVWIRHNDELYRLRRTASGKLILQK